jgi:hypothetical protein
MGKYYSAISIVDTALLIAQKSEESLWWMTKPKLSAVP